MKKTDECPRNEAFLISSGTGKCHIIPLFPSPAVFWDDLGSVLFQAATGPQAPSFPVTAYRTVFVMCG